MRFILGINHNVNPNKTIVTKKCFLTAFNAVNNVNAFSNLGTTIGSGLRHLVLFRGCKGVPAKNQIHVSEESEEVAPAVPFDGQPAFADELDVARAVHKVRYLERHGERVFFFRAMRCAVRSRYENETRKCILAISDSDAVRVGAAVE